LVLFFLRISELKWFEDKISFLKNFAILTEFISSLFVAIAEGITLWLIFRYLTSKQILDIILAFAFFITPFVIIFLLKIPRKERRERLNGYLFAEEYNSIMKVKGKKRVCEIKIKFKALKDGVDRWVHGLPWAEYGNPKWKLLSPNGCQLFGPIPTPSRAFLSYASYEIKFPNPLKKNKDLQEVNLIITLPDPDNIAESYFSEIIDQFGKVGKFKMEIIFEEPPFPDKYILRAYKSKELIPSITKELVISSIENNYRKVCEEISETGENIQYIINWYYKDLEINVD